MVERAGWEQLFERLVSGEFELSEGPTLAASVRRAGKSQPVGWAINDVVVRSGMQMVEVELYVDGKYVNTYPGDGMIVASPQGSTAYCMAAGGPILAAGVRGFAVTPISAHSPIRSTLVVPEESVVEIVVVNDHECALIIDGVLNAQLQRGDIIAVERGAESFRLILTHEMNFYEAFRSKFNYLIRPDAVPSLGHDREQP
jgi:NAD+ kinase